MAEEEKGKGGCLGSIAALLAAFAAHGGCQKIFRHVDDVHIPTSHVEIPSNPHVEIPSNPRIETPPRVPGLPRTGIDPVTPPEPLPPSSRPNFNIAPLTQDAQKRLQQSAKDAALAYLYSSANDKSFEAVKLAALEAAREESIKQGYFVSDATLNLTATLAATSALAQYEQDQKG